MMRALEPSALDRVEGVNGSNLYGMRIPSGTREFGPLQTVPDFHCFPTGDVQKAEKQFPDVNELIEMHDNSRYGTRFTHGDLSSANILVDGDTVVGIVDWDTSGWYPEYWGYTLAWNVNVFNELWRDKVGNLIQDYPEAQRKEQIRLKYFGDFECDRKHMPRG